MWLLKCRDGSALYRYTLTPSCATLAASTYRSDIASLGEARAGHPPASCSRSIGVLFLAARIAQVCLRSRSLGPSTPISPSGLAMRPSCGPPRRLRLQRLSPAARS